MQLEAIYRDGQLQFSQPVHFRHRTFRVVVEVPDEEILDEAPAPLHETPPEAPHAVRPEVSQHAARMRKTLDEILTRPPPPDAELPPLADRALERIEAFKHREER